ncbi:uncharacterized protein RSE6_12898 [Rhynchosporium secalis]|uniref:DUF4045 domain-containing protein n=1 Tax=Rhynchosporium secalis TaxID=38038 RepID=A0A1E1MRJ1_RHYSE|nr:uncharacterized protein RSE6_12898 [Rhynchosporium secalis]
MTSQQGSEDVNDFLLRIKELSDRRDSEDEERNRKLEEEILQGRAERQARRAERARSISPTKSSPAGTPIASRESAAPLTALSRTLSPKLEPKADFEPQREMGFDEAMDRLTGSTSPTKENNSPSDADRVVAETDTKRNISTKPSPSNAMPSRNSPLSWQRRPNSQSSDRVQSRPLSMVATENAARSPRAIPDPEVSPTTEPTREQIAQSLAAKDPAWFRQTADRGLKSPAYRKNQVEDEDRSEHGSDSSRVQMPGMSRQSSEPDKVTDEGAVRPTSPSRSSASFGSGLRASHQSTHKLPGTSSPMPISTAQRLDPPIDSKSENRGLAMSPAQGRISPDKMDRPPSPTKGMGGFVQSAMMKRSDSVNKRWSVQSPPGLSRGNSVASNRNSVVEPREFKPSTLSREPSPRPNSRPSSSHSIATLTQERPGTANSTKSITTASTTNDGFVKPTIPASKTQTPLGVRTTQPDDSETPAYRLTTPPTSPSKTMDSRRWSPTKSSWLESALNKPDSPKPKAAAPQQPAWMAEINKAKKKPSVDLGSNSSGPPKHEVNIGGLLRSPPPGGVTKALSTGGLPLGFSSGTLSKSTAENVSSEAKDSPKPINSTGSATSISPANGKIKLETPPKKDFRASLKSRAPPTDTSGPSEPEFKNVFGQLRRTKTQNYVAPDELKANITRGKAALSLTGGPRKTERVDDFKDAILKKKDDFKKAQSEGKGVMRSASGGSQEAPLPEALAKRRALGRSDSIISETGTLESPPRSRAPSIPKPSLVKEESAQGRPQSRETPASKLAGRMNPGLAGLLARGPPPLDNRSSSPAQSQRPTSMSTSTSEPAEPGPQLTHMTKDRARGPRRKAPTSTTEASDTTTNDAVGKPAIEGKSPKPLPLQVNTTPKPKVLERIQSPSAIIERPSSPTKSVDRVPSPTKILDRFPQSPTKVADSPASQPSSPRKLDMKRRSQFLQDAAAKEDLKAKLQLDTPKPLSPKQANSLEIPMKPVLEPIIRDAPSPRSKPSTPTASPSLSKHSVRSPAVSAIESPETAKLRPQPLSPRKTTPVEQSLGTPKALQPLSVSADKVDCEHTVSVKNATSMWGSSTTSTATPPCARSPIKLPTHEDEKAAMVVAGLRPVSPVKSNAPVGLGIQGPRARPLPTPPTKPLPQSANPGPRSLHQSKKSLDVSVPQASEASQLLGDFFGEHRQHLEFNVDTAEILSSRPDMNQDIKTLRATLYQFSNDGKKQEVPSHEERILFEGNLYLCTHVLGNAAGRRITESYFWQGDDVSTSVADDIEMFAQREAKSAGGKLIKIRQGKETPEFFNALGGIIIIRRGPSNKYDSLAPHILCARKHFGQIAFDEVDFSPASLCSGFPYLISTQSGKAFLWKGKGSGVDELSCARLIGMDFGLTGELEEVEDGSETESFLEIFGNGASIPASADHWRMKPNYNKYSGRLFVADSAARSQITEISPFCQSDLDASKIYVLDAFFEIYIIIGSRSQSQYPAFQNALNFGQEYGILAAGMEDRPFVPVTTVVLEGVPKDMKSVFRKWVDARSITFHKPVVGDLRRKKSLRVVPLTAALEATRS